MESHLRIDSGIKRGPKNMRASVNRKRTPDGSRIAQIIPPDLDPKQVLERYLSEETTSQIAQSYGLSRKTLTAWLRDKCPEQWRRVQIIRALDRKEIGEEGLEVAPDALSLARARELVRSAQWELGALDKDYQPHIHQTIDITSNLGDKLRAAERVIEGRIVPESVSFTQQVANPGEQVDTDQS